MSFRYEIYAYRDIREAHADALLAGNGLSISYSPRFSYGSLYQAAAPFMEETVSAIFEALGTTNFELALREINQAIGLNGLVGNDSGRLPDIYADIRQALVRVVQQVHPEKTDIDAPRTVREPDPAPKDAGTAGSPSLACVLAASAPFSQPRTI